jgi:hypothetical protein
MKSLLMILNPRRIPDCMTAIEALDIDKCWFSAMTEVDLIPHLNQMIQDTNYDRYLIVSDDCIPTQSALDKVLWLHDTYDTVSTGYCNLDATSLYVNLTRNVLPEPPPQVESYDLLLQGEVDKESDPFHTTFSGFVFTCMRRAEWLQYPMMVSEAGAQTDYTLSYRLQQSGIKIITHKDTFVYHVKETWNTHDKAREKRMMIGELEPSIYWS